MLNRWVLRAVLAVGSGVLALDAAEAKEPATTEKHAAIYDQRADGDKKIASALAIAKRDNKRVLLKFGSNWCSWCRKLHGLFGSDKVIARKLLYEYELVRIDAAKIDGKRHNGELDKRYGHPTKHGLPVLVVLDRDGKQLTTQETGALEKGDGHDRAKVLAFLTRWQAPPESAEEVLSSALARAKAESKKVFVHFSAPWCPYCRKLDAYLLREGVARVFGRAFVGVKIDVDRMTGGKEVQGKYRSNPKEGIPFFVILDADGKKLADANGPDGNVGFPVTPSEVAYFMKILHAAAPGLGADQLAVLEAGLKLE